MNTLMSEKAGQGMSVIDPYSRALRQQQEDLGSLSVDKAGQKVQDLVNKVNLDAGPVGGALSTISKTKQAVGTIRDRLNSVAQKGQSAINTITGQSAKDNDVSPLRQAELQKSYPEENPSKDPSSNIGVLGSEDNVATPKQVSAQVQARTQTTIRQADDTSHLNPFGGPSKGSLGGIDGAGDNAIRQGTSVIRQNRLNVNTLANGGDNISNQLGARLNFSKPPMPNPHANLSGATDDWVSKVSSTASKVGEGVDTGLGIAGDVMDAFGPVGDLIGLGLSIFGGIEGHKAEEQKEQAQNQQQQLVAKPIQTNVAGQIGATLKTAGQQQVLQGHS